MEKKRIYLDHAATTPLDERVLSAMLPHLTEGYGNPSAIYREGVEAKRVLTDARTRVARVLGAHADEIIFTASGTEADNLALRGVRGKHIVTLAIEHPAILETCRYLEEGGVSVTHLPVDENGGVSVASVKDVLTTDTVLVSVMYANNEIGSIEPIQKIGRMIKEYRTEHNTKTPYFHTDASQAPNYLDLNVERLGVDLLTLDGSKIYGPKGVGTLYVRRGTPLSPIIFGGAQERGLRAGTENVAGIVGFTQALSLAVEMRESETERVRVLRDLFEKKLLEMIPNITITAREGERLPNISHISIPGLDAEFALFELDVRGISASARSACKTEATVSHVLQAIGVDSTSSLRFSLGRETSEEDILQTLSVLKEIVLKHHS